MRKVRRPFTDDGLFILGLVGRAGSGKSTVASVFERRGAQLIEADRIGHEVTDGDPEVRAALIEDYGPEVYLPDGTLDRGRVAARVFTREAARERLNQLVHPKIVERIRERVLGLIDEGFRGVVVVDAALMLDWNLERACDGVLAVTAPEEDQVRRLVESRGWTEAEARHRLNAQRTNESYARAADAVIRNDGTLEELERAASETLEMLQRDREKTG